MTTNVLTVDCLNDKSAVPLDILEYEVQCQKSGDVDVHASVEYISKLGRDCCSQKSTLPHAITQRHTETHT